jgi:hypothetical protein
MSKVANKLAIEEINDRLYIGELLIDLQSFLASLAICRVMTPESWIELDKLNTKINKAIIRGNSCSEA